MKRIFIDPQAIPLDLKKSIADQLRRYSVNLVGVRDPSHCGHCGSGTLVKVDQCLYVLTAAHCFNEIKEMKATRIGLAINDAPSRFSIPVPSCQTVIGRPPFGEWGPDLALLPIPMNESAGSLQGKKSVSDLRLRKDEMCNSRPDAEQGLWFVVGAPAERSVTEHGRGIDFGQSVQVVELRDWRHRDDFDYYDVVVYCDSPNVPKCFKGVSGGGIWRVDVHRSVNGEWQSLPPPKLEGVAFWQNEPENNERVVRCHGRGSIYGSLLEHLDRSRDGVQSPGEEE